MTITWHVSRKKLETVLFNTYKSRIFCRDTPLDTGGAGVRWLSGVELQNVKIRRGDGPGEARVATATGETQSGTTVTESFTTPELFAELEYRVSTIRDVDVNAERYENVDTSILTVRRPLSVDVLSWAVPMIKLGPRTYEPTKIPGTNTRFEEVFFIWGGWGKSVFMPKAFKNPSSIPGLRKATTGYRLSDDTSSLIVRADYTPAQAVATAPDPNTGQVPGWQTFYEGPQPSALNGQDLSVEYDRELLEIEGRHRMQAIVDRLSQTQNFHAHSINARWRADLDLVKHPQTGSMHTLPRGGITATAKGDIPNSCYWVNMDFDVTSVERMRMLESWEPNYAPGRIRYTQRTFAEADGWEEFWCDALTFCFHELFKGVGGFLFGEPGELAGDILADQLEEWQVTYDEFEPAAESKGVWYRDVGQTGTDLGMITLSALDVDAEGLQMRYDGTVQPEQPGRAAVEFTSMGPWYYWDNGCEFAPRGRPRKEVAIRNTGTETLRICGIEKISEDPDYVYSHPTKTSIWLEPGGTETLSIDASLDDDQTQAPYDVTYRLLTNVGPRLLTIEPAVALSQEDYDNQIVSSFWFDPRDCLNLEVWPWEDDIMVWDLLNPPGPWPWEGPFLRQFHVRFQGMPEETGVVLGTGGDDLAQFDAVDGRLIGSIAGDPDELMDDLFVRLTGEPEEFPTDVEEVFGTRLSDWHLQQQYDLPGTATELVIFQETLWTVSNNQLLGYSLENPAALHRDQPLRIDDAQQVCQWGDTLTVLRETHLERYRPTSGADQELEQAGLWEHDGLTRVRARGDVLFGVDSAGLHTMSADEGSLETLDTLDLDDATDLVIVNDSVVVLTGDQLTLVDASRPDALRRVDTWVDGEPAGLDTMGTIVGVETDDETLQLLRIGEEGFESVGQYEGDRRTLRAKRTNGVAFTLRPDGEAIQSFRVVERPGAYPIENE